MPTCLTAAKVCKTYNSQAHLVIVNSGVEQQAIANFMATQNGQCSATHSHSTCCRVCLIIANLRNHSVVFFGVSRV